MSKDYSELERAELTYTEADALSSDTSAQPDERTSMSNMPAYQAKNMPDNRQVAPVAGREKAVDLGAQVGFIRNLEFSAGGRAHRISTGPYTKD